MDHIILLGPNPKSTESLKQKFTDVFSDYDISVYRPNSPKAKAALLLINAKDGPTGITADQLIEMRKNKTQNVFGIVYNSSEISDPELLELVKMETAGLLKKYGYFSSKFIVFSDEDDLEQFATFVREHINDVNQMNFDIPTFHCPFCGYNEHKKFTSCPSCQKKQKESFWARIFGSKSI